MNWINLEEHYYNLELVRKISFIDSSVVLEFINGDRTVLYNLGDIRELLINKLTNDSRTNS